MPKSKLWIAMENIAAKQASINGAVSSRPPEVAIQYRATLAGALECGGNAISVLISCWHKIAAAGTDDAHHQRLRSDRPHPRAIRITVDHGRMNMADSTMHKELADLWRDVDADPAVNALVSTGASEPLRAPPH